MKEEEAVKISRTKLDRNSQSSQSYLWRIYLNYQPLKLNVNGSDTLISSVLPFST